VKTALSNETVSAAVSGLLRRFADRLPVAALRDEARRRAIRLAIAALPFPEVPAEAAAVEERVFREGV